MRDIYRYMDILEKSKLQVNLAARVQRERLLLRVHFFASRYLIYGFIFFPDSEVSHNLL